MTEQEDFGQRLMSARSLQGMSQHALGEASGVAPAQISRYESGKSSPRPEVVAKLAKALGTEFDWLFSGNGVPPVGAPRPRQGPVFYGDPRALVMALPDDLHALLTEAATKNQRGLIDEVAARLQKSFDLPSNYITNEECDSALQRAALRHEGEQFVMAAVRNMLAGHVVGMFKRVPQSKRSEGVMAAYEFALALRTPDAPGLEEAVEKIYGSTRLASALRRQQQKLQQQMDTKHVAGKQFGENWDLPEK